MLTCKKCLSELHEDQKVCIVCGTRTIRGDGYDWEHLGWQWRKPAKYIAGAIALFYLIVLIVNVVRVDPPEVVTKKWFDCLLERKLSKARYLSTPAFERSLADNNDDMRAVSDEYILLLNGDAARYKVSKPQLTGGKAVVRITIGAGLDQRKIDVELVKVGRRWKVNSRNWA